MVRRAKGKNLSPDTIIARSGLGGYLLVNILIAMDLSG